MSHSSHTMLTEPLTSLGAGRDAGFQKRISSSFCRWEGSIVLPTAAEKVPDVQAQRQSEQRHMDQNEMGSKKAEAA
jgi:hypothetical protein